MGSSNRILLVAPHSIVEPLGLFYLSTVARQEGWEPKIFLTKFDYDKKNSDPVNLIALCISCNIKVNKNRKSSIHTRIVWG